MLRKLLQQEKTDILKEWTAALTETYDMDASRFITTQKDPFANPVGNAFNQSMEILFDELTGEMNPEKIKSGIDPLVRIRAIQDFAPSQAVAFVFALKGIIRKKLKKELQNISLINEFFLLDMDMDKIAMAAFDVYMKCRETLNEIKVNDVKNLTFKAFEKAGLFADSK